MVFELVILHGQVIGGHPSNCDDTPPLRHNTLVHNRPDVGHLPIQSSPVCHTIAVTGVSQYGSTPLSFFHKQHKSESSLVFNIHNSFLTVQWVSDPNPSYAGISSGVLLFINIQVNL